MKKYIIHLAGLTLAGTILSPLAFAQSARTPAATPPPPGRLERIEVETDDDDGPFALARTAVEGADRTVKKIFAGNMAESSERPLIVSSSSVDEKALANLDEDLTIMARILAKSVDRGAASDDDPKAMGIHLWAIGQGSRGARNLYLEGYGAVFIVNVNMPLVEPPSKPKAEEKKEPVNSTWEEARNELFGREDRREKRAERRLAQPYNGERVENLKRNLSEALKNASHIRGLRDGEFVTIVVQGSGGDYGIQRLLTNPKSENHFDAFTFALADGKSTARSIMTLRAKKTDIDAFAKGKTELDDFRKRVSVTTYQTPNDDSGAEAKRAKRF